MSLVADLSAGCIFGPYAYDKSSTWKEPGLYSQLAQLESAPPDGYDIVRQLPFKPLPFPDASLGAWDGAQPWHVEWGGYELWSGYNGAKVAIASGDAGPASRDSFLDFARIMVVADEATLADLADKFAASIQDYSPDARWGPNQPIGRNAVEVTSPISFANIAAAMDNVPVNTTVHGLGGIERSGAGFTVSYNVPIRIMKGSAGGKDFELRVAPDDTARFHHEGGPNVNDTQMRAALPAFMAALGRTPPANVTFEHMHGD